MTLHRAGEDYLKALYILQKDNGIVHSADIARRLKLSRASVSHGVKLLLDEGLVRMDKDKRLHLTKAGSKSAEQIYEKHLVLKTWLCRLDYTCLPSMPIFSIRSWRLLSCCF